VAIFQLYASFMRLKTKRNMFQKSSERETNFVDSIKKVMITVGGAILYI